MKIAVLQFPGTNCEFETLVAVKAVGMDGEIFRWNRSAGELSSFDGYFIPGGFSYQDRVRAGAIASKEPVMQALREEAAAGKPIIGICNGFQILVESGLLPGTGKIDMALAQNVMTAGGQIVRRGYYCDWINLRHEVPSKRCSASFLVERGALLKLPMRLARGRAAGLGRARGPGTRRLGRAQLGLGLGLGPEHRRAVAEPGRAQHGDSDDQQWDGACRVLLLASLHSGGASCAWAKTATAPT